MWRKHKRNFRHFQMKMWRIWVLQKFRRKHWKIPDKIWVFFNSSKDSNTLYASYFIGLNDRSMLRVHFEKRNVLHGSQSFGPVFVFLWPDSENRVSIGGTGLHVYCCKDWRNFSSKNWRLSEVSWWRVFKQSNQNDGIFDFKKYSMNSPSSYTIQLFKLADDSMRQFYFLSFWLCSL